ETELSPNPPTSMPVPPPDPAYPATIAPNASPLGSKAGFTGRVKSLNTDPGAPAYGLLRSRYPSVGNAPSACAPIAVTQLNPSALTSTAPLPAPNSGPALPLG